MSRCFIAFAFLCYFSASHAAITMKWKQIYIPTAESAPEGLEAIIAWPDDGKRHYLALLTNGSPRNAEERRKMTAISSLPIVEEFVKRNFSVAWVLRRGYGSSGGGWVEDYKDCSYNAYHKAALAGIRDLQSAIDYLGGMPQFDLSRILVLGYSAGGYVSVALTTNPPPGLVGVINFAGGRGARHHGHVCGEEGLVKNFNSFGKASKIPSLWIYAKNDDFFDPNMASKFYNAFTEGGGKAEFIAAEPYGDKGHALFSVAGIEKWSPLINEFLIKLKLQASEKLLVIKKKSNLKILSRMTNAEQVAFKKFMKAAPHKAFADNGKSRFGWRTGRRTIEEAKDEALEICQKEDKYDCSIIAIDNNML